MKKRPTSVSVIAWLLIVSGGLSVFMVAITMNNPMTKEIMAQTSVSVPVQYAMMYAGLAIAFVSGIGMLKGQNWARFLYIVWAAISFTFSFITSPIKTAIIPGAIIFGIIVFFLFRPAANKYFTGTEVQDDTENA